MAVAFGGRTDDLGRDVEVPDQPADNHQLLPVLFAEYGDVGLDLIEQLGHHHRDAAEHRWPEVAFESLGRAARRRIAHRYPGDEALGIHFGGRRGEHQGAAGPGQQGGVLGLAPRIGPQILVGGELRGVDEDAGHHLVGATCGLLNQRQVPIVQRPHCGHEAHGEALTAPVADRRAQSLDRAGDGQGRGGFGHGERVNPAP